MIAMNKADVFLLLSWFLIGISYIGWKFRRVYDRLDEINGKINNKLDLKYPEDKWP
jgi:hypothetical protein